MSKIVEEIFDFFLGKSIFEPIVSLNKEYSYRPLGRLLLYIIWVILVMIHPLFLLLGVMVMLSLILKLLYEAWAR